MSTMQKLPWMMALLLSSSGAMAQYYYKDIVSTQNLKADMETYRKNKVKKIIISSYESSGDKSEGFFCEKKISNNYRQSDLFTNTQGNGSSVLSSVFNDQLQLMQTTDSSEIAVSHSAYQYDAQGRLVSITTISRSSDDDYVNELIEEHIYQYENLHVPVSMFRVLNHKDTTRILFSMDEHENLSIEKNTKTAAKYYYYYDNKDRITDIVHMNEYKERMIPDYQFEYNKNGQLVEMLATEEGSNDYIIWRYFYENDLRIGEKVFSKDRKLMGRIEYEYK